MIKKRTPFLLLAVTILLGVFLKHDFVRFLIGFELILYAAGILEVQYLARRVEGELWLEQSIVRKNEPFLLKVKVKNKSRLPAAELFVRVAVRVFPDQEEVLLTGKPVLDAGEEGMVAFSMNSQYCGCLEVRLERIMVQDHLGLFQRRGNGKKDKEPAKPQLLFIFPDENVQAASIPGLNLFSEGEEGQDVRNAHSGDDLVEIRTYREGDLFKMVHWKLSARMEDLMVKEMGKTGERLYRIFLDLEEPERLQKGRPLKTFRRDRKKWDVFFEKLQAVTRTLVSAGQAFCVVWMDEQRGGIRQYLVKDGAGQREMMCALLHTDGYPPGDSAELARELPARYGKPETDGMYGAYETHEAYGAYGIKGKTEREAEDEIIRICL